MLSNVPVLLKVVAAEIVTVELLSAEIVPKLLSVVIVDSVEVVGRVIFAPKLLVNVAMPEKVADEPSPPDIVPALVRVVMLESVAVFGRVKVAPELLVKVVGLKFNVALDAKFTVPELVNVPPVVVTVPVD